MNDVTEKELKIVVERAVRPVRATMSRKRKMREELLEHLASIFKEEMQKAGDDQAALEKAKRRFGDPGELTTQLQQAVPRRDRWRSVLENMGYQSGESVWHLAGKHFLVILMLYAVILPVGLPMMLAFVKLPHAGTAEVLFRAVLALALIVLVGALVNTVLSLILSPLLNKIGPPLARRRWGRIVLAVLCVLILPFAFSGAFAGAAVVFILMARQATEEWRYEEGWA